MGVYSHIKLDVVHMQALKESLGGRPDVQQSSNELLRIFPISPRHAAVARHLKRYGRAGLATLPSVDCFRFSAQETAQRDRFRPQR